MLLCACAASASNNEPAENTPLDGYARTGAMSACVDVEKIGAITALDDMTFLIHGENAAYLSASAAPCVGAAGKRIEYETHQSSICRNDIVSVVDHGTGEKIRSCALGDFEALLQTEVAPAHNRQD